MDKDQDVAMDDDGTAKGGIGTLSADTVDDMNEYALEVRRYHDTQGGQHGRTSGSKYNLA